MMPFLVCIHDATPAYGREMEIMLHDLVPLLGRRLAVGVVPNWHGAWSLTDYPDYCQMILENCDELLLHGYFHQRQRGGGLTSWLTQGADEMNGLNPEETYGVLTHGQHLLSEAFGTSAQGFLAPGWQQGSVRRSNGNRVGLKYVMGFFALESWSGQRIPLATWTWDCGRWEWLGHVGHGIGTLRHSSTRNVPTLAIHPRDLERGFWPRILRLTQSLLDSGYTPCTPASLFEAQC